MTDMTYALYGPLEIPRIRDGKKVAKDQLGDFWDKAADGVAMANGCYIFGIRAGRGSVPWYVGQAKRTFRRECFTDRNLLQYNDVLHERRATPILLLLARVTPKRNEFKAKLNPAEADWVEKQLVHHCLNANSDLLNVSGTAFQKRVVIPGLHNNPPGPLPGEAQALRQLLSLG